MVSVNDSNEVESIKRQIITHKRQLRLLEKTRTHEDRNVDLGTVVEIKEVETKVEELKDQLPPKSFAKITLDHDVDFFSTKQMDTARRAFSTVLEIPTDQIQISFPSAGSVDLLIQIPQEALGRLIALYESDNSTIRKLKIQKIELIDDVKEINLSKASLAKFDLFNIDLSSTNLSGIVLSRTDLSGANLSGVDLGMAELTSCDLSGADLSGANLSGVILKGTILRGANLHKVNLTRAILGGAILGDTNLSGANLSGADLRYTDLTTVDLSNIVSDEYTKWPRSMTRLSKE